MWIFELLKLKLMPRVGDFVNMIQPFLLKAWNALETFVPLESHLAKDERVL
jgi:hypothetical protein